ncbi:MAG: DUF2789 domain-containing protein [Sterolibacterium sp.]|nr:DUF2789 domain-containing protein [Sterolibacterium sp.]
MSCPYPYSLECLFAQLGLPSEPAGIEGFIARHRPLADDIAIYRAPFWNASQKTFLIEELIRDADWALVIDELNYRLR